ncbi:MAG: hypothetical protein IJ856_04230 [Candidatus Methanomethylophilaceae archaeon]|nr:hypothetical protein [Candidatus Methanomethylophilaceae archaeon]
MDQDRLYWIAVAGGVVTLASLALDWGGSSGIGMLSSDDATSKAVSATVLVLGAAITAVSLCMAARFHSELSNRMAPMVAIVAVACLFADYLVIWNLDVEPLGTMVSVAGSLVTILGCALPMMLDRFERGRYCLYRKRR